MSAVHSAEAEVLTAPPTDVRPDAGQYDPHGHLDDIDVSALARDRVSDPTRTKTLRRRYAQTLRAPFRAIRAEIRRGVGRDDRLGLSAEAESLAAEALSPDIDELENYEFKRSGRKRRHFEKWLAEQLRTTVLTTIRRGRNQYIKKAYDRGVAHAKQQLDESGADLDAAFNAPIRKRTLRRLYSRNFSLLQDITRDVGDELSETLTTGLANGWGATKTARKLNDRIGAVGLWRATLLARTETINAFTEGTLDRFEATDEVDEVAGRAELITAEDNRVCEDCEDLDGETFPIDEARGIIPVHPMCRCAFVRPQPKHGGLHHSCQTHLRLANSTAPPRPASPFSRPTRATTDR